MQVGSGTVNHGSLHCPLERSSCQVNLAQARLPLVRDSSRMLSSNEPSASSAICASLVGGWAGIAGGEIVQESPPSVLLMKQEWGTPPARRGTVLRTQATRREAEFRCPAR